MGGFSFSAETAPLNGKKKLATNKKRIKTIMNLSLVFISYLPFGLISIIKNYFPSPLGDCVLIRHASESWHPGIWNYSIKLQMDSGFVRKYLKHLPSPCGRGWGGGGTKITPTLSLPPQRGRGIN
jgi:hypothetical protein